MVRDLVCRLSFVEPYFLDSLTLSRKFEDWQPEIKQQVTIFCSFRNKLMWRTASVIGYCGSNQYSVKLIMARNGAQTKKSAPRLVTFDYLTWLPKTLTQLITPPFQ
jgi:hypothetical protein